MEPVVHARHRRHHHRLLAIELHVTAVTLQLCLTLLMVLCWIPHVTLQMAVAAAECASYYGRPTSEMPDVCLCAVGRGIARWTLYVGYTLAPVLILILHMRAGAIVRGWWQRNFGLNAEAFAERRMSSSYRMAMHRQSITSTAL
jgi:hypothetical protein